jgi:hypothetical protein
MTFIELMLLVWGLNLLTAGLAYVIIKRKL